MTKQENLATKRLTIQNNKKVGVDICIINNSSVVQEGICSYIEKLGNINSIICSSKEYFEKELTNNHFDIIITDIEFNLSVDPIIIKSIKTAHPESQIMVFTRLENGYMRNASINYGATFFIYWGDQFQLLEIVTNAMIKKSLTEED